MTLNPLLHDLAHAAVDDDTLFPRAIETILADFRTATLPHATIRRLRRLVRDLVPPTPDDRAVLRLISRIFRLEQSEGGLLA